MADLGKNQELEVKFYINDLAAMEKRLIAKNSKLIQARTHEYNLRFDNPKGTLSEAMSLLRLRKDSGNHLTFKGPSTTLSGVLARKEIEFDVSNFESARKFIEALGFTDKFVYEKYRTTYDIGVHKITLDEMPYGNFLEIEGPEAASIRETADVLQLEWEEKLPDSYVSIFQRINDLDNLKINDLTFENFRNIDFKMSRLGIKYADLNSTP